MMTDQTAGHYRWPALYAQDGRRVKFVYTNWRGETSERQVEMYAVFWGATEWHPEPQWMLQAFDLEKREHRLFAMRDIKDVQHEILSADCREHRCPAAGA
jgi:predicted DNA-binding transcriptional regulator YafY